MLRPLRLVHLKRSLLKLKLILLTLKALSKLLIILCQNLDVSLLIKIHWLIRYGVDVDDLVVALLVSELELSSLLKQLVSDRG